MEIDVFPPQMQPGQDQRRWASELYSEGRPERHREIQDTGRTGGKRGRHHLVARNNHNPPPIILSSVFLSRNSLNCKEGRQELYPIIVACFSLMQSRVIPQGAFLPL